MNTHMSFEIASTFEGVVALFTTKRLLARMFMQHVCLEITIMTCAVITLCASKRLLATVNPHVIFEPTKSITYVVAFVGCLPIIPGLLRLCCWIDCAGISSF